MFPRCAVICIWRVQEVKSSPQLPHLTSWKNSLTEQPYPQLIEAAICSKSFLDFDTDNLASASLEDLRAFLYSAEKQTSAPAGTWTPAQTPGTQVQTFNPHTHCEVSTSLQNSNDASNSSHMPMSISLFSVPSYTLWICLIYLPSSIALPSCTRLQPPFSLQILPHGGNEEILAVQDNTSHTQTWCYSQCLRPQQPKGRSWPTLKSTGFCQAQNFSPLL